MDRAAEERVETFLEGKRGEFVHTLLDSLDEAVVACDADGVLVLFNPAAERMHGLPAAAIAADAWGEHYDLFCPDGTTRMATEDIPLFRALRGEIVQNVELVIAPRHGRACRVLCNGRAIVGRSGEKIGAVAVMHDVTDLFDAEFRSREARAFLDSIVENIPNMIFVKEASDLRFMLFNRAGEELLGQPRAALIGKNDYDFFPRAQADFFTTKDRAVLAGKGVVDVPEEEIDTPKGARLLHTQKIPILGEDGTPRYLLGISEDITERKIAAERAQELLREQAKLAEARSASARVAAILESITDSFFAVDHDFRFTYLNREAERTLQRTRAELLGKVLWQEFPQLVGSVFEREYGTAMRERRSIAFEAYYAPVQRQLEVRVFPAEEGLSVYFRDITERHQAARRDRLLSEASRVLATTFDYEVAMRRFAGVALPELGDFCFFDLLADGVITRVAWEHVDPTKEEAFKAILELTPQLSAEAHPVARAIRTQRPVFVPDFSSARAEEAATSQRHLEFIRDFRARSLITVPILFGDRCLGALTFVHSTSGRTHSTHDLDIAVEVAERAAIAINNAMLYRELNDAVRARDEFLSIASHELKTPLTTMKLQLEVRLRRLRAGDYTRFTPEGLLRMSKQDSAQVDRVAGLIDEMLDISRINAGRLSLRREPIELCALIEDVVARLGAQITENGADFRLELARPVEGAWDRSRVDQVVTNLVTNALKYGGGKPIVVAAWMRDDVAVLEVRDQGIGISTEDQKRVFQRFERAVSASAVSGLGLGLYICKQVVEAHGGTIDVASEPGHGSRFTVSLPSG